MIQPPNETIEPYLEALCSEPDPGERDRIVLDCVFALGAARAAAIWKRMAGRDRRRGGERRWHMTLARGPLDALSRQDEVQACLDGRLTLELPGRRVVLGVPGRADELALALGEVENADGRIDWLEGLLLVWGAAAVDAAPVDALAPLRPATKNEPCTATLVRSICARACARLGVDIKLNVDPALAGERCALNGIEFVNALEHLLAASCRVSDRGVVSVSWHRTGPTALLLTVESQSTGTRAGAADGKDGDRGAYRAELMRRVEAAGGSLEQALEISGRTRFLLRLPALP